MRNIKRYCRAQHTKISRQRKRSGDFLCRRPRGVFLDAFEDAADLLGVFQSLKDFPNLCSAKILSIAELRDLHRAILHDPLHDVVDEGDLLLVVERSIEELGEGGACSLLREPCERTDKYPEGGGRRLIIRTRSPRAKTEYT